MTEAVPPAVSASPSERADLAAWLAVAAGTLGALMAMLDISIVNASLPTIQGEIGATSSEGTWIGTAYLVAEIVIIPLTAWLERMLGLRRLLLIAASMFTVFSMLCGVAANLQIMILGRIGQGLAGGTMIPTALSIIAHRLPPDKQSVGVALFGGAVVLGPVIGPLLGGWITENYSWHYAFFINLPVCIGLIVLLITSLPKAKGDWHELWSADWFGIVGMVIGLGSLTVLLEEGHREQWFESALIQQLGVASVTGFILVGWGQWKSVRPVLRLAILRNRALAASVSLMLAMGTVLFSTAFMIPQFLAILAGYNAFQAGKVVFLAGITSACMMPLFPILIARVDTRLLIVAAALIVALSSFIASHLTSVSDASAFMVTQLLLGAGSAVMGLTLQQSAVAAVPLADSSEASGLIVVARNLGGSIGLASTASFQDQRLEFHHWQLHSALGANDLGIQRYVADLTGRFGGGLEGVQAAYKALDGQVMTQALVMSFNDVFLALSCFMLLMAPLAFLMRPIRPGSSAMVTH